MATPAMDFDSTTEVIDLDDELLPEDDVFTQTSKA
jgi:twitching motility protein PilJ